MKTWIDPEELAYVTPNGGHSRSQRRGMVYWPDGKLRTVLLGVADTYWTMPAHGRITGKYASGYVAMNEDQAYNADVPEDEYVFFVPTLASA